MFARTSRYAAVESAVHSDPRGHETTYKRLRILSDPSVLRTHEVRPEDRLDLIAHEYLGDAEHFWRVVDANRGLMPAALVREVGRRLRIPLPGS